MLEVTFIRHGKTDQAPKGCPDIDRQLSAIGEKQAADLAELLQRAGGFDLVISSPAPRARRTACIATAVADPDLIIVDNLHPDPSAGIGKKIDTLFNKLGYAPLSAYLNEESGDAVTDWATATWPLIIAAAQARSAMYVAVFGHAVLLPALGVLACTGNANLVARIAAIELKECSGFTVLFNAKGQPRKIVTTDEW